MSCTLFDGQECLSFLDDKIQALEIMIPALRLPPDDISDWPRTEIKRRTSRKVSLVRTSVQTPTPASKLKHLESFNDGEFQRILRVPMNQLSQLLLVFPVHGRRVDEFPGHFVR